MEKSLILVNDYPSSDNLYANGFVHRRVKLYQSKNSFSPDVFVLKKNNTAHFYQYTFDGVNVYVGNKEVLKSFFEKNDYQNILVHFINRHMISVLRKVNLPIVIWIHGSEALSWKRRLFNLNLVDVKSFIKYVFQNERQLMAFRKFLKNNQNRIELIFVSEWMKQIFEKDVRVTIKNTKIKTYIIPNLIDEKLFKYTQKHLNQRFKILSIRPYTSKKYANDVVTGAIDILSQHHLFSKMEFTLVGDGPDFKKYTKKLKNFSNVNLKQKFAEHSEIALLHEQNGVFLCPTRQDAQGVSMCEAMSSGLVPISTMNTAIPEFVTEGTGILIYKNSAALLAKEIISLIESPNKFKQMSSNAAIKIREICSENVTIEKELLIIMGSLNKPNEYSI